MIAAAYPQNDVAVGATAEAGPDPTRPDPGQHWPPAGAPVRSPHEYLRAGTAKLLTLFHPASGEVRVKGGRPCPNAVLHPWLKAELTTILAGLPEPTDVVNPAEQRRCWARWQAGLTVRISRPEPPPPRRLVLVMDHLTGHDPGDFVRWLFAHGSRPLYTPLGGSGRNLAESIPRLRKRRAWDGQHPRTPEEIIAWREAAARG